MCYSLCTLTPLIPLCFLRLRLCGPFRIHGKKCLLYKWAQGTPGVSIVDHYKEVDDFYMLDGKLVEEKVAVKDPDVKAIDKYLEWIYDKFKGEDKLSVADLAKQRNISARVEVKQNEDVCVSYVYV